VARAREPQRPERPGFLGGAKIFFQGFGFIVGRPAMWLLAAVPVVAALTMTVLLAWLGIATAQSAVDALFGPASSATGAWRELGSWIARVLLYVLAVVAAILAGTALAQPISGPALDRIARAQEIALGVAPREETRTSFFVSVGRALRVTLVTLAIGAPILLLLTIVELVFPPAAVVTLPLKFIVSALLATWDLVDYAFGLRETGVRDRWGWYRENFRACLGFGAFVALVALVPFVGLLMLPVGVAGATRLVVTTAPPQPRALARRTGPV
jgi:CysZ protein